MFYGCTSLISAPALPATSLSEYCYYRMFYGCTSLVSAPALPAITLADFCYSYMFYDCTSLVSAPTLPATNLANCCYRYMFYGCTSLVSAPALPAITLANYCYSYMFYGCTSLVSAPTLPAITLADYCYQGMFYNCVTLIEAPIINIPDSTYNSAAQNMFYGCSSLSRVEISISTWNSTMMNNWLYSVAATGDFYCPADLTIPEGPSGIPQGWTRHDLDEVELNFTMPYGGNISLNKVGTPTNVTLEYRLNGDSTWKTWVADNNGNRSINVPPSRIFYVRNTSNTPTRFSTGTNNHYYYFSFSNITKANGNINSLICKIPGDYGIYNTTYSRIFYDCQTLITSPLLPSTNLSLSNASYVYYTSFAGCRLLITPPSLPATTLGSNTYYYMFSSCTSLVSAPALPATNLIEACYYAMFSNCISLASASTISAPTLRSNCCIYMFRNCYSLVYPPQIECTSIVTNSTASMYYMFTNCCNLIESPILKISTLSDTTYRLLFYACRRLKKIVTYMTDISASRCLDNWVYAVPSGGDFYCDPNLTIPVGTSGIPSGWTRHSLDELSPSN